MTTRPDRPPAGPSPDSPPPGPRRMVAALRGQPNPHLPPGAPHPDAPAPGAPTKRTRAVRAVRVAGMVAGFVLLTSGLFAWDVVGLVLIAGSAGAR